MRRGTERVSLTSGVELDARASLILKLEGGEYGGDAAVCRERGKDTGRGEGGRTGESGSLVTTHCTLESAAWFHVLAQLPWSLTVRGFPDLSVL